VVALLGFHLVMNRLPRRSGQRSADPAGGLWLALAGRPHCRYCACYTSSSRSPAWLYAALGARMAPHRLQMLALAS
jgi:hypothetical protein